jgi:hypothetical protein
VTGGQAEEGEEELRTPSKWEHSRDGGSRLGGWRLSSQAGVASAPMPVLCVAHWVPEWASKVQSSVAVLTELTSIHPVIHPPYPGVGASVHDAWLAPVRAVVTLDAQMSAEDFYGIIRRQIASAGSGRQHDSQGERGDGGAGGLDSFQIEDCVVSASVPHYFSVPPTSPCSPAAAAAAASASFGHHTEQGSEPYGAGGRSVCPLHPQSRTPLQLALSTPLHDAIITHHLASFVSLVAYHSVI